MSETYLRLLEKIQTANYWFEYMSDVRMMGLSLLKTMRAIRIADPSKA